MRSWLQARPESWLAVVDVVALDPFRGYATGLLEHLGHARVVIDHFHAVRLANAAIDDVRRRVQPTPSGTGAGAAIRSTASAAPAARLRAAPPAGLGTSRVRPRRRRPRRRGGRRLAGEERLRRVYSASSLRSARQELDAFCAHCANADVPELDRLAKTVRSWETEILAFQTTNGPTEAVNLLIEKIRRVGHGFRNYDNYRLRLLLRCGIKWHTAPTARIRGRHPRSVA